MIAFGRYSKYYDLLNQAKDYAAEVSYVSKKIRFYAPEAKSILDIGCGTGIHAANLVKLGYQVTGIDRSEDMVEQARGNAVRICPNSQYGSINFSVGDIRDFSCTEEFDVIVSLFHVISYLSTNEDLNAAFANITKHVRPGGILIFDHWYGPAVLSDRPAFRVRTFEDDEVKIYRIATPTIHANLNTVDIKYDFIILEKSSGKYGEFSEKHSMRYLFFPEIEQLLSRHNFKVISFSEWMSEKEPNDKSWNTVIVAARG